MIREFKEEAGVDTLPEDWREFAILSEAYFELHCYICVSDKIFCQVHQPADNDEQITTIVSNLYYMEKVISNLPWLINMCLDEDADRITAVVHYEDPNAE
jgi:hypothetical protein